MPSKTVGFDICVISHKLLALDPQSVFIKGKSVDSPLLILRLV